MTRNRYVCVDIYILHIHMEKMLELIGIEAYKVKL